MTKVEVKKCQNCHNDFQIEPEDSAFYERIKVPAPTFCPECRLRRRMLFRNERTLYKRTCDLCGKEMIAMQPKEAPFPVYCHACWWSDKWDAMDLGADYDFSKPFFVQFLELLLKTPRLNLFQRNSKDSPFANVLGESKRVYLAYSTVGSEEIYYSWNTDKSTNIFDSFVTLESEYCYENLFGSKNYNSAFLTLSRNCMNSTFLFDCANCSNCFMSSGLRNKEFYIQNKGYTKDEYFARLSSFGMGSSQSIGTLKEEFKKLRSNALHKYANINKSVDVTGDNIMNAKNAKSSFDVHDVENVKYMFRTPVIKDSMDCSFCGLESELIYEYIEGSKTGSNILFSIGALEAVNNMAYVNYCRSSSFLFGCCGLRSKQYCVLNKQYTKEEYEELIPRIIKHMNDMPYTDSKGRVYRYGEFFPPELSPFAYNETIAQEYFPLTKAEVLAQGYRWKDPDTKEYTVTKKPEALPDHIKDVDDSITKETIGCAHEGKCNHQCTTAFKIISEELSFYRRMNLPVPRLCPNCRHYARIAQRNPLKLWHRQCMCDKSNHSHKDHCQNEFETSYAPERKEIVYCEQCYNSEVV